MIVTKIDAALTFGSPPMTSIDCLRGIARNIEYKLSLSLCLIEIDFDITLRTKAKQS